jgi:hypothetical protein
MLPPLIDQTRDGPATTSAIAAKNPECTLVSFMYHILTCHKGLAVATAPGCPQRQGAAEHCLKSSGFAFLLQPTSSLINRTS